MAPPAGSPSEYTEPFNKAFTQMNEGIKNCVDGFNALVNKVKKWAWLLGAAALLWIKNSLDKARKALEDIMAKLKYALEHQTPVISLMIISFDWIYKVKTPVSELSFTCTKPVNENLTKWTGDAASSYNTKATQQKGAVDDCVAKAEYISQWLFKVAKGNVEFATELAKIITGLAGKFAQALVDASGVVTIPWAIDTLGEAVGDLVTSGLNILLEVGNRLVDALGAVRDLAGAAGDHSKLPGGKWPEAVKG
ncbi:MAG TPA: hypothetical protein DGT23_10545 [Micromonosporaceae bacterium]|nr:hypothetical protein [Micromonosporaceae bacterium]